MLATVLKNTKHKFMSIASKDGLLYLKNMEFSVKSNNEIHLYHSGFLTKLENINEVTINENGDILTGSLIITTYV